MKNPTAAGWYWVWRLGKDVDRNISCVLYWGVATEFHSGVPVGTGWHDTDDMNFVDGGQPHTREFPAWSGPLLPRTPPESQDEVEAEYARASGVAPEWDGDAGDTLNALLVCAACKGPASERYTPFLKGTGVLSCGSLKCRLKIKGAAEAHLNGCNRSASPAPSDPAARLVTATPAGPGSSVECLFECERCGRRMMNRSMDPPTCSWCHNEDRY